MKRNLFCIFLTCSFALVGCNKYKGTNPQVETSYEDFKEIFSDVINKRPKYNTVSVTYKGISSVTNEDIDNKNIASIFNGFFELAEEHTATYKLPDNFPIPFSYSDYIDLLIEKESEGGNIERVLLGCSQYETDLIEYAFDYSGMEEYEMSEPTLESSASYILEYAKYISDKQTYFIERLLSHFSGCSFTYFKSPGFKLVIKKDSKNYAEFVWNSEGYIEHFGKSTFTWSNS